MNHREGYFSSHDNTRLYFQLWAHSDESSSTNQDASKAIIAIVHGAGEHCGRYTNVVNHFVERGYVLYGFDFRGHGKSGGKPGHVMSWLEYREDLDAFLKFIREENPSQPLYLYAHSMGGQVALDYLTQAEPSQNWNSKLSGAIISAPALARPNVSPLLIGLGKLLSRIWPGLMLENGLEVKAISRDPEVVKSYLDDPLVGSKVSARFGAEFMACIDRVQSNASKFQLPLFMFHGEADQIIPVTGTQRFFNKVGATDKALKIYPGGFHEPHNDSQKVEVFQDVVRWLESRA